MQVTQHRFYTRVFCSGSMAQVTVVSKSESELPIDREVRDFGAKIRDTTTCCWCPSQAVCSVCLTICNRLLFWGSRIEVCHVHCKAWDSRRGDARLKARMKSDLVWVCFSLVSELWTLKSIASSHHFLTKYTDNIGVGWLYRKMHTLLLWNSMATWLGSCFGPCGKNPVTRNLLEWFVHVPNGSSQSSIVAFLWCCITLLSLAMAHRTPCGMGVFSKDLLFLLMHSQSWS